MNCAVSISTARALRRLSGRRGLATHIFDTELKAHHRDRAAAAPDHANYAYLHEEVARRLMDRLDDIHESYEFADAVDLSCGPGHVRRALGGRGVQRLTEYDTSQTMLTLSAADASGPHPPEFEVTQVHAHEEIPRLPKASADLIVSCMGMHWVNELPQLLTTVRRALRPNGLFLGAMLGGDTLQEMRSAFVLADLERRGGVAQRMSPLATVADCGALLQAAGFALPTVDTDKIVVHYPDAWTLWHHLRSMGESHAVRSRAASDRDTMLAAAAAYSSLYGDEDGQVPATFQMIYLTGWGPHESQARPAPRGSAGVSLKDLGLPGEQGLLPGEPPDPGSKPSS